MIFSQIQNWLTAAVHKTAARNSCEILVQPIFGHSPEKEKELLMCVCLISLPQKKNRFMEFLDFWVLRLYSCEARQLCSRLFPPDHEKKRRWGSPFSMFDLPEPSELFGFSPKAINPHIFFGRSLHNVHAH